MVAARPLRLHDVRAALWTLTTLRSIRRQLSGGQVDRLEVPRPATIPATASRGLYGVLRRRRNSCLERALLLQAWYATHGNPRDVVIGVTGPHGFAAHAWLDGETRCHDEGFREILRLPAL